MQRQIVFSLLLGTLSAFAADPDHAIQEDQTGSRFKRILAISPLPLTATYAELSEQDRRRVRRWYDEMPEEDEPPYPEHGMIDLVDGFRRIQKKALITGQLRAAVRVDETGKGRSLQIFETPDPDLNQAFAFVALHARYKPAICSGKPCVMDFPIEENFSIEPEPFN